MILIAMARFKLWLHAPLFSQLVMSCTPPPHALPNDTPLQMGRIGIHRRISCLVYILEPQCTLSVTSDATITVSP
eukprot:UN18300